MKLDAGIAGQIEWARKITKKPLRQCRYLNECRLCGRSIFHGEAYFDGGYGRRAHKECVDKLLQ